MKYFKFFIPRMADGTPASYSIGWHGTLGRCPSNAKVLCYNDKEGYGLACTPDDTLPEGISPMSKADCDKQLARLKPEAGVHIGDEAIYKKFADMVETEPVIIEEKPETDLEELG